MGWGYGINSKGREVGYSVDATCDHPECDERINRGLGYVCGTIHDDEQYGCGGYFCQAHLGSYEHEDGTDCAVCDACRKEFDRMRTDGKDGWGDPVGPCPACGGDGFDPDSLNGDCACVG